MHALALPRVRAATCFSACTQAHNFVAVRVVWRSGDSFTARSHKQGANQLSPNLEESGLAITTSAIRWASPPLPVDGHSLCAVLAHQVRWPLLQRSAPSMEARSLVG